MKNLLPPLHRILFVFILVVITSCADKQPTEKELIAEYYQGFQNADYNQIKATIADSLTLTEADYIMPFSKESFYGHFKWDSVFQPVYKKVDLQNTGEQYVVEIAVSSKRFAFLKNDPLVSRQRFYFKSGKISRVENVEFVDTDWEKWTTQRESLVNWTAVNHPELDGFINDLTMQGAINYVKAIELYENRELDGTE